MDAWIQEETTRCPFPDERLQARLGKILQGLSKNVGNTLPLACQDWASTNAAYRFLDNPRVEESLILAGPF